MSNSSSRNEKGNCCPLPISNQSLPSLSRLPDDNDSNKKEEKADKERVDTFKRLEDALGTWRAAGELSNQISREVIKSKILRLKRSQQEIQRDTRAKRRRRFRNEEVEGRNGCHQEESSTSASSGGGPTAEVANSSPGEVSAEKVCAEDVKCVQRLMVLSKRLCQAQKLFESEIVHLLRSDES